MNKLFRLTKNITDASGDTDLFIPAGVVVQLVNYELEYYIVETLDGSECFAVHLDEIEEVPNDSQDH